MLDDIRSIMAGLRDRDRRELEEYGFDREAAALAFASPAIVARVFAHEGRPVAVVAFHHLTPKALVVSMMATDAWRRVARAALRWGLGEAKPSLLSLGYERAECRTMQGHAEAIGLLERLGFVCECRLARFGASGAAFLQYAWRLSDHVR
jgi:RimJ/RimL family protein N-acetyltransferase